MRGHIRRRGEHSYEYIVDIGMASAQRCQVCKRRFWVERKPKGCCPRCGGELAETEERRRAIKGGFATRRECEAALAKVLAALEAQTFRPPTRITVKAFLLRRVAAHRQRHPAPDHLRKLRDARARAHHPASGCPCSYRSSSPAAINGLYAYLLRSTVASAAAGGCRGPRCAASTPSCTAPVATPCAGEPDGQPGRLGRSPQGKCRTRTSRPVWNAEQLARASLSSVAGDRLFALWRVLAMTGMRRGEALGLRWEDVDMEQGSPDHPPRLVPVNGVAQISEPKTRRSRRTIALDPVTLEALEGPRRPPGRRAVELAGESWLEIGLVFTRARTVEHL